MVPVCSLNVYDAYSRDLAPRSVNVVKQDLNGCNGGYLDIIQELVALKSLQEDDNPFFVMDVGCINGIVENWCAKMPNVRPFYLMRCNPDQVLLKRLTEKSDVGLCCSSRLELEVAMKYIGQDRILYANPLWTRANIRHAKECEVQLVVIESGDDLKRFSQYFPEANIILRVVMDPPLMNGLVLMDKLDVEKAIELLCVAKDLPCKITGISLSVRANAPSPTIFSYAVAQCRRLFDVGLEMGHRMSVLDLGDGFPSAAATGGLSFEQTVGALGAAISLFFPQDLFGHVNVIAEPGSYFAASPYFLVTRVVDRRLVDASVLTCDESDAGTVGYIYQINEGFYGAFGCRMITLRDPKCSPVVDSAEKLNTYATVFGPAPCDTTDVVLSLTRLPPLQVGDWLIWYDMGAYTMGNCGTLSGDGLPSLSVHYFEGSGARAYFPDYTTFSSSTDNAPGLVCGTDESASAVNDWLNSISNPDDENHGHDPGLIITEQSEVELWNLSNGKYFLWQNATEG